MSIIITLDLGTTGNRCLAIDKTGTIVAQAYHEFPQIYPKPGWVEHDPMVIWETTLAVLKQVLTKVDVNHIQVLGITNQRETIVAWNKVTGKPLYNAIVWQCRRTTERCKQLGDDYAVMVKKKTGLSIDPYFSASKMEWLFEHVSEVKLLADKQQLCFGTIDSWIIWNLTKGKHFVTDASNASRTMLFDINLSSYDADLLTLFKIPLHTLPDVLDSDACFGYTDESHTKRAIPIHAVLGDQQASLFAQCGSDTTMLKNTYGTGLFVIGYTADKVVLTDSLIGTVAWRLAGKTSYALEGSIFVGGSAIQWLRDGLGLISDAAETERIAQSVESTDGVVFVPALTGLGAPYWDSGARGTLCGLTRGTTKAHIVRATLESLAFQTKAVIDDIKLVYPDYSFQTLRVDGGAANNAFLMQFQADILGMTIHKPTVTELTAYGVAGLAGMAVNVWSESEFRKTITIQKSYLSMFNDSKISEYYQQWTKAIKRSKNWI